MFKKTLFQKMGNKTLKTNFDIPNLKKEVSFRKMKISLRFVNLHQILGGNSKLRDHMTIFIPCNSSL